MRATRNPTAVARSREMKRKYWPVVKRPVEQIGADGGEDEHTIRNGVEDGAGGAAEIGEARDEAIEEVGDRRGDDEDEPRVSGRGA